MLYQCVITDHAGFYTLYVLEICQQTQKIPGIIHETKNVFDPAIQIADF